MTKTSLQTFINEVKNAWGPLSSETVADCHRHLVELAQATFTVNGTENEILGSPSDLAAGKELYRDPEHGFILLAYTETEGQYRVPHDHGSGWVIYAVVSGEMEMGTYIRSINRKGQLSLVRRESFRMHSGNCKVFLPGDIHDTRSISPSVLILRLTSCDLQNEDREGRMIRYPDSARFPSL
jgi:hypothetical protein